MNLFILDKDIKKNAKAHCDKHIVKMPLEAMQMIFVAAYFSLGITHKDELEERKEEIREKYFKGFPLLEEDGTIKLYGMPHINHPCTVWIRKSRENFEWACDFGIALCDEYENRYGREMQFKKAFQYFKKKFAKRFKTNGRRSPFVTCISYEECHTGEVVSSYRKYYVLYKSAFAKWNYSEKPEWFNEEYVKQIDKDYGLS